MKTNLTAPTKAELLAEIDRYCEQYGIGHGRFGKMACNDSGLYVRLKRETYSPRLNKVQQIISQLRTATATTLPVGDLL